MLTAGIYGHNIEGYYKGKLGAEDGEWLGKQTWKTAHSQHH